MTPPPDIGPLNAPDRLTDALREQGLPPDEVEETVAMLGRLAAWPAPVPTSADTAQLVQRLTLQLPALSPVRPAARARPIGLWGELGWLLAVTRSQASIFRPSFWLASAGLVLLGLVLILGDTGLDQRVALQIIGPLLAYLGTASAFRPVGLGVLEMELACPPSPRQLTISRLVIVLGYDVSLGLLLSLPLWLHGTAAPLTVTLVWLAPLLLVAGVAVLLSLCLPVALAASVAYAGWLSGLALMGRMGVASSQGDTVSIPSELALGVVGLVLLGLAVRALPAATPRLLPQT